MINNFIIITITFVFFFTVNFFIFSFFYFIFDDFFIFIFFNLDLCFHLFYPFFFLRGDGGFAAAGSVGVRNQRFEICNNFLSTNLQL